MASAPSFPPDVHGTMSSSGDARTPAPASPRASAGGAAQATAGAKLWTSSVETAEVSAEAMQTLTEPVWHTIRRDLRAIGLKLKLVCLPSTAPDANEAALAQLKDWDLWGPLLLCLVLSIILSLRAPLSQASTVFASVFVVVWVGTAIVTINAKLLGGAISFFQSMCVLGYCLCPLVVAACLCALLRFTMLQTLLVGGALVWSMKAAVVFIGQCVPPTRSVLALYPVLLFYTTISWMVYIQ